jgi:hypothetical protein
MMKSSYLYPSITSLPVEYDCEIAPPVSQLTDALGVSDAEIEYIIQIYCAGDLLFEITQSITYRGGVALGDPDLTFKWRPDDHGQTEHGFAEVTFKSATDYPIFRRTDSLPFYAIYHAPGRKTFFSDNSYKYGSPPVIEQIARFGTYIDTYPIVHISRPLNLSATLVLINPHLRPLVAQVLTAEGRKLNRIRVNALTAKRVPLVELLHDRECELHCQVQITATNRAVTYIMTHALDDPSDITDHEHLDPFRADPTHMPLTLWLRYKTGRFLKNRNLLKSIWDKS